MLATVKGDVHDIGKNLVDIILSNNGYNVVNIGIKQPVSAILEAAEEHARPDVVGMSGLLVKSTVIMKENLEELNQRNLATRFPVILGGAALTRAYVEEDLLRHLRRRSPLRPRRLRRPAPHGRPHGRQTRRPRRRTSAAQAPQGRRRHARGDRAGRHARTLRRIRLPTRCRSRRSGATASSRASSSPTTCPGSTSAPPSWGSGASSPPAAATGPPTRNSSRPKAARACATGSTASSPTTSSKRPSSTATSRASPRATT
ncbi:cobalamin-dependent protein [Yinghuangia aomiensis]